MIYTMDANIGDREGREKGEGGHSSPVDVREREGVGLRGSADTYPVGRKQVAPFMRNGSGGQVGESESCARKGACVSGLTHTH